MDNAKVLAPKRTQRELRELIAPEGRAIMVLGSFCWGRGKDVKSAYRKAREEGSVATPKGWCVLEVDPKAYVDDMGGVCWPQSAARPIELGYLKARK